MKAPHASFTPSVAKKTRRIQLAGIIILLLAMAAGALWWSNRTYHLASVQDGVLYRSGNRNINEFAIGIRRDRIKTVVSLIDDQELNDPKKPQFRQEAEFLRKNEITLDRIPVRLGGYPTHDDLQQFISIVSDPTNQPVLVHCAQGVRRTGMFVAAYQESALGYDQAKTKDAIETFGHSDQTIHDIRSFIDGYDPLKMSVATQPARGVE